ncbi:unnamed protein product [Phytophthora lilii]|uniref:RxLR effector protein n=1 Tax=Phytophthora lilii TaxID=2077276 RepID=A0A9W6TV02_9STRA|nr:unnamed protein product [Phytophthora lilii]
MRQYLLMLLGTTFLVTVTTAMVAAPGFPALDQSLEPLSRDKSVNRLLRNHTTVDDSDYSKGERGLTNVLEKLKNSRKFSKWAKNGVSADEAFKLLKLRLELLAMLRRCLQQAVPRPEDVTWSHAQYAYDDKSYYSMLENALKKPETKDIAQRYETEYLNILLHEGKLARDVLERLGIRSDYRVDRLSTWVKYVRLANKENPEATMVKVLITNFDKEHLMKEMQEWMAWPESKVFATKLLAIMKSYVSR